MDALAPKHLQAPHPHPHPIGRPLPRAVGPPAGSAHSGFPQEGSPRQGRTWLDRLPCGETRPGQEHHAEAARSLHTGETADEGFPLAGGRLAKGLAPTCPAFSLPAREGATGARPGAPARPGSELAASAWSSRLLWPLRHFTCSLSLGASSSLEPIAYVFLSGAGDIVTSQGPLTPVPFCSGRAVASQQSPFLGLASAWR